MNGIEQYVKDNLRYNSLTGRLTWKVAGQGRVLGNDAGCEGQGGYIRLNILGKSVPAHRICWYLHYGDWPERDLDHKNRRPNDNRIQNLRLATKAENARNRSSSRGSSSQYKGVSLVRGQWRAAVACGDKRVSQSFKSEIAAAMWHDVQARKMHGEFASLNFPEFDAEVAVKKIKAA